MQFLQANDKAAQAIQLLASWVLYTLIQYIYASS